jgi:hypothetical protein
MRDLAMMHTLAKHRRIARPPLSCNGSNQNFATFTDGPLRWQSRHRFRVDDAELVFQTQVPSLSKAMSNDEAAAGPAGNPRQDEAMTGPKSMTQAEIDAGLPAAGCRRFSRRRSRARDLAILAMGGV